MPIPSHGATTMISSRREGLSDRELEILDCLVNGHSNKVIARRCNITEATVKVHLKAILRKISVANRTQAAVWALNKMHRAAAAAQAPLPMGLDQVAFGVASGGGQAGEAEEPDEAASRAVEPPHVLALMNSHVASALPVTGAH